jgi:pSer/pThr/pTyr-binding forkhead associated (FHA) protein
MLLLVEHLEEKNNYAVFKREIMVVISSSDPVIVTIGRKVDCDVSFPNDKSISRKHCHFTVYPSGALTITDLKSSFGTYVHGIKCPPNEESPLEDKIHLKFGNEFTNIRISKYKFCNTRLNKAEKDRLKEVCRAVGGEMVNKMYQSSQLICNR